MDLRMWISLGLLILLLVGITVYLYLVTAMPGKSVREGKSRDISLEEELRNTVVHLSREIGERNFVHYEALQTAKDYLARRFTEAGYRVQEERYSYKGRHFTNVWVEIPGRNSELVVVGGHYDSVVGAAGANDNATGVAATLALARLLRGSTFSATVRFVAFVNEEPPFYRTEMMGSRVHAANLKKEGRRVRAMISLETVGYFTDSEKSQRYPWPLSLFYPGRGNFIAFVGKISSRSLLHRVIGEFRKRAEFPSEGAALPAFLPGVSWSDHWSFWREGYPAVMVTDTALFRYPHYHTPQDTADKVDFRRLAKVVVGLEPVIRHLAEE